MLRLNSLKLALTLGTVASAVVMAAFILGTRYGKGAVPMTAEIINRIADAASPSDFAVSKKSAWLYITIEPPDVPSVNLIWYPRESVPGWGVVRYQIGWAYAPTTAEITRREGDYRDVVSSKESTLLPALKQLLRLTSALTPDEFATGVYGHPERKHFSPDRLNIEVLLSYPEDLKWDRTLGYAVLPPDAVNSPVYMASCDPRPENKVKKDSYYNECLAILKHIKEKFLAPARKLFPEIPETRVTTIAPPKLTDKQKVKHLD